MFNIYNNNNKCIISITFFILLITWVYWMVKKAKNTIILITCHIYTYTNRKYNTSTIYILCHNAEQYK